VNGMTTSPRPRITLHDPGELIAAIPPLLGFRPVDSLVLAVFGGAGQAELRLTVRADLPPPTLHNELANHLVNPLLRVDSCAVTLVVVGGGVGGDSPGSLPHRELVAVVEKVLNHVDVPVLHSLWVDAIRTGALWRCYDDADCAGTVPDTDGSAVAAAAAAVGATTFPSREDLAATITPADEPALARRRSMIEQATRPGDRDSGLPRARGRQLVADLISRSPEELVPLTDNEIVDLAVALSDPAIRDACLGSAFGDQADAAQWVWGELTRGSPAPYRAEPACLLAFAAYVRGDGALAGMALDRAVEARSGHRLALLLRCAIDTGLPPDDVRAMLARLPTGGFVRSPTP